MSMDFGMDRCLQPDAHQSHSVDADWIVKYITRQESNAFLCVKFMQWSIFGLCGVKYHLYKPYIILIVLDVFLRE